MVLVVAALAWIAGIYTGTQIGLPPLFMLASLLPLVLLPVRDFRKIVLVAAAALLLFTGAAVYSHASLFDITDNDLCYYNDLGEMELRGRVADLPDARDASTRFEVEAESITVDGEERRVEGRLLVFVPRYPGYHYGDVVILSGEPQTPPEMDGFDYRGYLEHRGITTVMYYPTISVQETGTGFPIFSWLHSVRSVLGDALSEALPEPQASLAQGILLGIRGTIPDEVREDFNRSGTAHLLAISGLHLGIMAGILLAIGIKVFGRRRGLYAWFALAGVWVYTALAGLGFPVLRAAIMASIFLVAELLGRQRSGLGALIAAAAVMTAISPYILGDASFQLSFLAMAGIIVIYPLLRDAGKNIVSRLTGKDDIGVEDSAALKLAAATADMASATMAALIAIWPVVAYHFGIVSLAGPLATLLTLPMLPFVIVLSGITAVTGLAIPVIGQGFGWLAWLFLSWLLLAAGWLGSGPLAAMEVAFVHPVIIVSYYIILAIMVWLVFRWKRRRNLLAGTSGLMRTGAGFALSFNRGWRTAPLLLLLIVAVAVVSIAAMTPDDNVRVSFLDVGQGDAIFVTQGNRQVLIDGGPGPQEVINRMGERMPFWDRTIELLVLTHPHNDHLAGLVEVLRRYRVERVVVPPMEYDSALYREWQRLIEEKNIAVTEVTAGWRIAVGDDITLKVLSPEDGTGETGDDTGLVLRLEASGVSFLLTADISGKTERELLRQRADLDADILKVSHHGSDESSITGFLAVVSPDIAVISCGEGNRYGHPGANTLTRLEEFIREDRIYRTDEDGSVEIIVGPGAEVVCWSEH